MSDIVLHHYETSPFAELVRAALGLKGLAWRSVIIPSMMPKPDLVELTGGYARTPVLQIGAELYCDTSAILAALEALQPMPSLYPRPLGPLHAMVAGWAGGAQFAAHVGSAMRNVPPGALPPGFAEDRKARFVGFDFDAMPRLAPHLETQVLAGATRLAETLADGRRFIGGEAAGHGDLSLYANLWFLKIMPFAKPFADRVFALPGLADWYERVAALGHGEPSPASAEDAIALAAASEPKDVNDPIDKDWTRGQRVRVKTETSGDQPVEGALLSVDAKAIVIRRRSERAGDLNVHFPRLGQILIAA